MTEANATSGLDETITPVASGSDGPSPELVCQIDWDDIVPRVIAYSKHRASLYGEPYKSRATEYALEAFELFLNGTRHFAATPQCTPFQFFCGTVKSLISHDSEKVGRRGNHVSLGVNAAESAPARFIYGNVSPSDDDIAGRLAFADDLERFIESLDADLQDYVRLRMEVDQTAAEHAASLGKTEKQIRNMDKRLKRRRIEWTTSS